MQIFRLGLGLLAALLPAIAPASPMQDAVDLATIDVRDAIECRLDAPVYTAFAMAVAGEEKLAEKRHWTAVKSPNFLLAEYVLPAPILVAGTYSTRRIAFTSSGILAILDEPDPAIVAQKVGVENAMGADGLVDALVASGKVTRAQAEAEITFRKFLGERVLRAVTDPADGEKFRARTTIALNVSNVTTHPGKTLYGCSYKMELLDKDGTPL